MASQPNDNLFESSTMTFGEHLEELRGALFRSLIGIVVGFLIGLLLATHVVQFIQTPLADALRQNSLDIAKVHLSEEFQDNPPPEMVAIIEEQGLVPQSLQVDAFRFLGRLRETYPNQFGHLEFRRHVVTRDDLDVGHVRQLCSRLARGESSDDLVSAFWKSLSKEQNEFVSETAKSSDIEPADRDHVVGLLNRLIDTARLVDSEQFNDSSIQSLDLDEHTQNTVDDLRSRLTAAHDSESSRRLNRLVLSSVFSSSLRRPRVNLVELDTWKSIDVGLQTLGVTEMFMIWIKAALLTGILISSPWIFWQIWQFVAAGLYPHERKYVYVYIPMSLFLFFAGGTLVFAFVFESVLDFLFSFNRRMNIEAAPRFSEWLSFVLFLPLGFGISFQLPLVMLVLHRIGIFTIESYLSKWRIAILVIFVLAMVLTPADPISMLMMAIPLTLLYFGGIALCRWMPRRKSPIGEGYDP